MLFEGCLRSITLLSNFNKVLMAGPRSTVAWCRGFYSATPLSAFVPRLATPGSAQSSVLSLLPKSSETSIVPAMYYQQTRTKARITYRPNVAKRLKKHGLLTRLSTRRGIVMLWNKVLKGRHNLST